MFENGLDSDVKYSTESVNDVKLQFQQKKEIQND